MSACRAIAAALLLSFHAGLPAHGSEDEPAAVAAPEADPSAPAPGVPAPPPADPSPAPVAVPPPGALIDRVTDEGLMELLRAEGFAPSFERPGVVRTRIESMTVLFFVADDCRSVQAFSGFRSTTASLETVNAWNRTHRYSRSYLDKDGDPVVELDLDLAGGVTRERMVDWLRTVRISVLAFVKAAVGGLPGQ